MKRGSRAGQGGRRAGDFSAWLHALRTAYLQDGVVDVPCGDCAACCTSSHFVHVGPGEALTRARIPEELLVAAPGAVAGTLLLGFDQKGRCPLLNGRRCEIYEDRPRTCRLYDCRVYTAAGVDADRDAITRQARAWAFSYPAARDRREHEAVRAAARFLREHAAAFPSGRAPSEPADIAITAVRVYDAFLGLPGEGGGDARPHRESDVPLSRAHGSLARQRSEEDVARAVIEANERFEEARSVPSRVVRKAGS
jgi:uncharacterized protein